MNVFDRWCHDFCQEHGGTLFLEQLEIGEAIMVDGNTPTPSHEVVKWVRDTGETHCGKRILSVCHAAIPKDWKASQWSLRSLSETLLGKLNALRFQIAELANG